MNRMAAAVAFGAVAVLVSAGAYAVDAATRADAEPALGPGLVTVRMGIHHSRFSTGRIHVRPGTLVRFVVENDDPIRHELIVGDDDVHARHANGPELEHPPVPGEVSVDPGDRGVTAYRFDEPGTVLFACHLPGHFEYGMTGQVVVAD